MAIERYIVPGVTFALLFCFSSVYAEISQVSTLGTNPAEMTYAAGLYGAQYECGVLNANGGVQGTVFHF